MPNAVRDLRDADACAAPTGQRNVVIALYFGPHRMRMHAHGCSCICIVHFHATGSPPMPDLATLRPHAARLSTVAVSELVGTGAARAQSLSLRVGPLYANFARQRYDAQALDALFALAERSDVAGAMRR